MGYVLKGALSRSEASRLMDTGSASVMASSDANTLTKANLALAFNDPKAIYRFPSEIDLPLTENQKIHAVVQYAFDPKLQAAMEGLFRSYGPDYGAFVAMDATTGRILSMVSYTRDQAHAEENLAVRATFPSASVFKVVTAAAAIAQKSYNPDTVIEFNGRNHTLYRSNILKTSYNRWTRHITLKEAFANSINTVFGKIGAFAVGSEGLRDYAGRFGFNRPIPADFPIQEGHAPVGDDAWALAETASGYTKDNTMSPMQGALIAATVANDGVMMEPYLIESVHTPDGTQIYKADAKVSAHSIDAKTAGEVRELMRETVTHGTSRKSFRGFFRGEMAMLDVGGKTGSLTGMDPPGKYDWFVGFGDAGSRKIAVAALTIHSKLWRVKSSYLARKAIETYFKGRVAETVATK